MILAIDFDGTLVRQDRPYDDLESPLVFMPDAELVVPALKAAGHVLLQWSARASRALLFDPMLNPLVRAGVVPLDIAAWKKSQPLNLARHRQMLDFLATRCPGWFDAIDDGAGGKPLVDVFIDDKALRLGRGRGATGWWAIGEMYGAEFEANDVAAALPPPPARSV